MFTHDYFLGLSHVLLIFGITMIVLYRLGKKASKKMYVESEKKVKEIAAKSYRDGASEMAKEMRKKIDQIQNQALIRKCTVKVATSGDALLAEGYSRIVIPGLTYPDGTVPVFIDFDRSRAVALAKPFKHEGDLFVHIDSVNGIAEHKQGYPAIGGVVEEFHEDVIDGINVRVIDRFRLTEVSICGIPNADPNIKSIAEQLHLK